jgi:hypothetical protein
MAKPPVLPHNAEGSIQARCKKGRIDRGNRLDSRAGLKIAATAVILGLTVRYIMPGLVPGIQPAADDCGRIRNGGFTLPKPRISRKRSRAEAHRVRVRAKRIVLSERDSLRVLERLENPPRPSAKLRCAARRHHEIFGQ